MRSRTRSLGLAPRIDDRGFILPGNYAAAREIILLGGGPTPSDLFRGIKEATLVLGIAETSEGNKNFRLGELNYLNESVASF